MVKNKVQEVQICIEELSYPSHHSYFSDLENKSEVVKNEINKIPIADLKIDDVLTIRVVYLKRLMSQLIMFQGLLRDLKKAKDTFQRLDQIK